MTKSRIWRTSLQADTNNEVDEKPSYTATPFWVLLTLSRPHVHPCKDKSVFTNIKSSLLNRKDPGEIEPLYPGLTQELEELSAWVVGLSVWGNSCRTLWPVKTFIGLRNGDWGHV